MVNKIKKSNGILIMLCVSFIVTLLLAGVGLRMEYDRRYALWVREQCMFQSAYWIDCTGIEDENGGMQADEILSSIPAVRHGVLSISMWYDGDELTQSCRVSYLFGDYGQIAYPLADGRRLSVKDGENALFVGQKYLNDIQREHGEEFLNIHGNLLHVDGILADMTGHKADERILLFGSGYPQDLKDMLGEEFVGWGNIVIEYFSNLPEHKEEVEEIRLWLSHVTGGNFETRSFQQADADAGSFSFGNAFICFAIYPVLICCFVNCLFLIGIYVRSRERETAIRRMYGMSYCRIAVMTGSDYAVILLPAAALTGLVTGFFAQVLVIGAILTILFTFISVGIMRIDFMRKGRCI